jgi:acetyltransferase-like isoleucine patch superfamily enzyme
MGLLLLAILPSRIKIPLYRRLLGWKIGQGVYIGLSFIDAEEVIIGDYVRIGHFSRFHCIPKLEIQYKTVIARWNLFAALPSKSRAIIEGASPSLFIGKDCYIMRGHFFDVQAPLRLENSVTIAGHGSAFYTHSMDYRKNRLVAKPIVIGENSYVGSNARFIPGARIAPNSFVGMGAVVTKVFDEQYVLLAGSPARIMRNLDREADWFTRERPRD